MSKPKVLVIENSVAVTGALKAIASSAECLKSSFQFQFLIPRNSTARSWLDKMNVTSIYEWKMIEIRKNIVSLFLYVPCLLYNVFRLKRFVKQNGIDLVHVNDLYNLIAPVAVWLGCKVPYVCHVRFMPDGFPKRLFDFWLKIHLRYACKVIVVSEALKNRLPAHDKIVCLYDGITIDQHEVRESVNPKGEFRFLYLGNIIKGKGQDYALKAFKQIQDRLPNWHLRFVGGDMGLERNRQYQNDLKNTARAYNIESKITWTGFTHDVKAEYRQADIVLNFSESESFSMTTLEASSLGRPVIVTACGGPTEIIDHGVTGLIVENRNVDQMAAAMLELALSPAMRTNMSSAAQDLMKKKFDLEVTSHKLGELYATCLKK